MVVFDSTYKMNGYGMIFVPFVGLNNHHKTTYLDLPSYQMRLNVHFLVASNFPESNMSPETLVNNH
jgi:hypothetical protein